MDLQNTIVAILLSMAAMYLGSLIWKKLKSFSPRGKMCGSGCGCGPVSKAERNSTDRK